MNAGLGRGSDGLAYKGALWTRENGFTWDQALFTAPRNDASTPWRVHFERWARHLFCALDEAGRARYRRITKTTEPTALNAPAHPDTAQLFPVPSNRVPDNARAGYFRTSDNVRLRYGRFGRTGPEHKGTVCLVQGRTEYIEKYFETIADFQSRGFTVATFDLRGQGMSDRLLPNRNLGHLERFEDYWIDLKSFHGEILLPDCPPPFYLVGHSTGGLVALLAATRDRLMFDRAFLTSPLIRLPGIALSPRGALALANLLRFFGLSGLPLQRKVDRAESAQRFETNILTHDQKRHARNAETVAAHPGLEVGAPTIGWIGASMEGMAKVAADGFASGLRIPVFIAAAANDKVVSTPAIEALALSMRTGHHVVIPGAYHELFQETDVVRAQVLAAFDAFVTDQTA